jgi:malate dehydrogenase (oxaloacetate-decarboxylating)(NADP+)
MDEQLVRSALDYHRFPTPGKISILPTKGLTNQRDLALANPLASPRPALR